jgi:hypothetical protein
MTNSEAWEKVIEYTSILSDNLRKLGFAAVAICWVFRSPEFLFPPAIIMSFAFTVIYFIFDILQYYVAAVVRRTWLYSEEEKRLKKNEPIDTGNYVMEKRLDYPAFVLWNVKTISLLVAYGFIIFHVFNIQHFAK